MPEARSLGARRGRGRGGLAVAGLAAALVALRGLTLYHSHSLNSLDGALQTWFALDHFARGEQLGTAFQSYLGITMVLALLPVFLVFGKTLFASTLAAYAAVLAAAFAAACACAWLIRPVPPPRRWQAAVVLAFLFYYAGPLAAQAVGLTWPATLDPGVSLRPWRGALGFLVLPLFVGLTRRVWLSGKALSGGLPLGLVAGTGLLWSNDAGIPLVIALAAGLVLALHARPALLARTLAAFALGTGLAAGTILLAATHGAPGPWLRYNFRDVAGDQFWFFAPWDRATRILGPADLPNIIAQADPLSAAAMALLGACAAFAAIQRLRGRGAPVRASAFVVLAASLLGTALVPQIGGHIGPEYNPITFVLGCCAPLIVAPAGLWRRANRLLRAPAPRQVALVTGTAALAMMGIEAGKLTTTARASDRTIHDPSLGFAVTPAYARDLAAMRRLGAAWEAEGLPAHRRLLSVYTSPLDIAAGVESPADVGSLIHALGPRKRAAVTALVADRQVAAVTTIYPGYSGWEGWLLRADWPFFRALRENYTPIARNDQQVLWVRSDGRRGPSGAGTCRITTAPDGRLVVAVAAAQEGLASVALTRSGPVATGRGAMLTVLEDSPDTDSAPGERWTGFPRYGIPNAPRLEILAPVRPGRTTSLTLERLDGSAVGGARCTARLYPVIDFAALPPLPQGIAAHLGAQS